jgi:uncharacterized protein YyaL (SSP411 family)
MRTAPELLLLVCLVPTHSGCAKIGPVEAQAKADAKAAADKLPPPKGQPPGSIRHSDDLRAAMEESIKAKGPDYVPRTHHKHPDGSAVYTNRLALEGSPYLLQHAHNPVDWFPWGEEAFARAKELNRPVFLSVGYSTCHWCHVMERESFEDEEIAEFMNTYYVAIKVDREERPDIDAVYMDAVNALAGRGGWPMSVWLTPTGKPFMGGTYFPARDGNRGSRKGFLSILQELVHEFHTDPAGVASRAAKITARLQRFAKPRPGSGVPGAAPLHAAFKALDGRFDEEHGGFGRAPKFPRPVTFELLLRYHRRTGNARALAMVTTTLDHMSRGGMYDQIGGGFHRYSTDRPWLTPHFEKMLYDNAQLVPIYLDAYQITGRADFARIATETLDYLDREMSDPGGGFWSATDADSEGEEGKFFVWKLDEVKTLVGPRFGEAFAEWFGMTPRGNFEHGTNILHRPHTNLPMFTKQRGLTHFAFERTLAEGSKRLYEVRKKRIPPLTDTKVLAAWNGLAISAFARAGLVLGRDDYTARASKAASFVLDKMRSGGRLLRVYAAGTASQKGFLDDHAFLITGLLDLFEASGEPRWLREAIALQAAQDRRFAAPGGAYWYGADDNETLLVRQLPTYDGAVPSGNSTAVLNLLRLAELTTNKAYRETADKALGAMASTLTRSPTSCPRLAAALGFRLDEPKEVVIVRPEGAPAADAALLKAFRSAYLPNRAFTRVSEGPALETQKALIPWLDGKRVQGGVATAYVCVGYACERPAKSARVLAKQLAKVAPLGE